MNAIQIIYIYMLTLCFKNRLTCNMFSLVFLLHWIYLYLITTHSNTWWMNARQIRIYYTRTDPHIIHMQRTIISWSYFIASQSEGFFFIKPVSCTVLLSVVIDWTSLWWLSWQPWSINNPDYMIAMATIT